MAVRVLIADDSPFWREQLKALLEHDTGWTVFEACDGLEAVKKTTWIYPDAVILDFYMPVLDGLGAARGLKRRRPELPVLIVTVDKTSGLEAGAHQAGVLAVFSKMHCMELCNFLRQRLETGAHNELPGGHTSCRGNHFQASSSLPTTSV